MGIEKRKIKHSVYDAILGQAETANCIVKTKFGDVLPSSADLAGAGVELITMDNPHFRLAEALKSVRDQYDVILIDCPPSLEMLTLNALAAADSILIPVQCEYYALEGLSDLMNTMRMVKRRINPRREIFSVVLTMFDGRTNFSDRWRRRCAGISPARSAPR